MSHISSDLALSMQKKKRKSFGFGVYQKKKDQWDDEIHIRELSLTEGGLGCALWDASIILARFIYEKQIIFNNMDILELGSGCGLPGIVAGLFGNVILSDYMPAVVENIQYNITVNRKDEAICRYSRENLDHSTAILLDWDQICDHDITPRDYIIGTELVYTPNEHHQTSLIKIIKQYLKPDGRVLLCQSDNRLDMPGFIERIASQGFQCKKIPVSGAYNHLLGNYQSKQVFETYCFYEFYRTTAAFFQDSEPQL